MSTTITHKFSDLISEKKSMELHVGTCMSPPKNFNIYDANQTDFFSVVLLTEGEATFKINLEEQILKKNSLVFHTPNTLKQLVRKTDDLEFFSIIFTTKFLISIGIQKQEFAMIGLNSGNIGNILSVNEKETQNFKHIVKDLKQKIDNSDEHPFGENIVHYTFRIFLSEMAALAVKYNTSKPGKSSRKQNLLEQFANLINLHFREHRAVKYYADLLSITPKYLTEIVHELTGQSASTLIDEKVMYEAKILLHNSKLTISQVAEILHFSDQSFLGKFFKRHLGLSPSEYRNHNFKPIVLTQQR